MDVPDLLREARTRASLSQADLAACGQVSRSTVGRYESGRLSPTVRQLEQLLSVCGLRLDVRLVALGDELEARVARAMQDDPSLDEDRLLRCAAAFDEHGVTWAADGATALGLQGIALRDELSFAVVDDDRFRVWAYRLSLRLRDRWGVHVPVGSGIPGDELEERLARGTASTMGLLELRLRVVDALPETTAVVVRDVPVRALGVLEAVRAHPEWAAVVREVLRRSAAG